MILPELDAGVEGGDEQEWSLRCSYNVACLRDGLDFVVFVVFHFDNRVWDSFSEEGVMVDSCSVVSSIVPALLWLWDVLVDGLVSFCFAGAANCIF